MNRTIAEFARKSIVAGLSKCTIDQVNLFKRMYCKDLSLDIKEMVDKMPDDKLDWALTQIENTLDKA